MSAIAALLLATSCEEVIDYTYVPFTTEDVGQVLNEERSDYRYASSITGDTVFTINGVSFEMIRVEGGTFMMGDESEESCSPVHEVTLSTYYIARTEVTQELYRAVMGHCPTSYSKANSPVGRISYTSTEYFCRMLREKTGFAFVLPTEAQWEFAARGGNKSRGYKFSGSNKASDVGYSEPRTSKEPKPVGSRKPNELGIYDMTGNMQEWCSTRHGKYTASSKVNPMGPVDGKGRVIRGGSWYHYPSSSTVYGRSWLEEKDFYNDTGFRLALR